MDIFQYRKERRVNLDEVFGIHHPTKDTFNLASGFRRLHHTMNKELRVWWDIATLEHYLAARMVPQRLRWDLQIYEGERTSETDLFWSNFFNECGLKLLERLVERKRKKLL